MPKYRYKAVDTDKRKISGEMEAENEMHLALLLKADKQYLISSKEYKEVKKKPYKAMKDMQVSTFAKEIASMTKSGIPLNKAMKVLFQSYEDSKLKQLYIEIYKNISNGMTLSQSLNQHRDVFPPLLIHMYKTAEESGKLPEVSERMAKMYENQYKVNSKVKAALLYPKILGCIMVLVVVGIFTLVMPRLFELFGDMQLPLPTRIALFFSKAIINYWYIIIMVVFALILFFKFLFSIDKVQYNYDKFKVNAPVIGKLNCTILTARFARTFVTLYESGLPIDKSMKICMDSIGNKYIENQFPHAISMLRTGSTISDAISSIKGINPKLTMSCVVGEESGNMDEMLENISDVFDEDAQSSAQKLISFLEPVLIVFLAVIVAFIALSIILPILKMYNNIQ